MATLTAPAVMDALKTRMDALASFTAQKGRFVTGPPNENDGWPHRTIALVAVRGTADIVTLGQHSRSREENYIIEGFAAAQANNPESDDVAIKRARDQVAALIASLAEVVNGETAWLEAINSNSHSLRAHLSTVDWDQGIDSDNNRQCVVTFGIAVVGRN